MQLSWSFFSFTNVWTPFLSSNACESLSSVCPNTLLNCATMVGLLYKSVTHDNPSPKVKISSFCDLPTTYHFGRSSETIVIFHEQSGVHPKAHLVAKEELKLNILNRLVPTEASHRSTPPLLKSPKVLSAGRQVTTQQNSSPQPHPNTPKSIIGFSMNTINTDDNPRE